MTTMIRAKTPFTHIPAARPRIAPPGGSDRGFQSVLAEQLDDQDAGEPAEERPGDRAESQKKWHHEDGPDQSADDGGPERLPGGAELDGARHSDGEIGQLCENRKDQQGNEDLEPDPFKSRDGRIQCGIDQDDDGPRKAEEDGEGAEQKHQDEQGQSSDLQGCQCYFIPFSPVGLIFSNISTIGLAMNTVE